MKQYFKAENRVREINKLTTCDKGPQDVLLKEALDSLVRCRHYVKQLVSSQTGYDAEVKFLNLQTLADYFSFFRPQLYQPSIFCKRVITRC